MTARTRPCEEIFRSLKEAAVTRSEIWRLEKYLRNLFRLDTITLLERPQSDSVEVHVAGEFIGALARASATGCVAMLNPIARQRARRSDWRSSIRCRGDTK